MGAEKLTTNSDVYRSTRTDVHEIVTPPRVLGDVWHDREMNVMTKPEHKSKVATLPSQFGLRAVFIAVAVVALVLAPFVAVQRALYRSPHQQAMDSVNGLDGWAREEDDGYVVADLNGGTCPIHDAVLKKLVDCQRLRKLTAYKTQITDAGLHYLRVHKDLRILHLDDCTGITDKSIPALSQLYWLNELSLTGTSISELGLQSLRAALPDCSIDPRSHGLAKQ